MSAFVPFWIICESYYPLQSKPFGCAKESILPSKKFPFLNFKELQILWVRRKKVRSSLASSNSGFLPR
ncbi:hypothetical protein V6N12_011797 [Hibiscus sabdariffa]|uniref:Uncharacterized protein n=1 Tax=Hibiscus sabdariffa TaxID=183260 RepID=A0ABR2BTL8_9ROSI